MKTRKEDEVNPGNRAINREDGQKEIPGQCLCTRLSQQPVQEQKTVGRGLQGKDGTDQLQLNVCKSHCYMFGMFERKQL